MEHSEKYGIVRRYYKNKLWDEQRVRKAVEKGWITTEEFEEITEKEY